MGGFALGFSSKQQKHKGITQSQSQAVSRQQPRTFPEPSFGAARTKLRSFQQGEETPLEGSLGVPNTGLSSDPPLKAQLLVV